MDPIVSETSQQENVHESEDSEITSKSEHESEENDLDEAVRKGLRKELFIKFSWFADIFGFHRYIYVLVKHLCWSSLGK